LHVLIVNQVMKIKELTLYTSELHKQRDFYLNTFNLQPYDRTATSFAVQLGHTKLIFKQSNTAYVYHYCFLIPNNRLQSAITWLQKRLTVISYEKGRVIEPGPEDWNSESVYFLDPTGNILEFIVRHDLDNDSDKPGFDATHIISVNEIGMASKHPEVLNAQIVSTLGSKLKYGNLDRFGANGSEDGLFLLVNYTKKKTWFPTSKFPTPSPFEGIFEQNDRLVNLKFTNESVQTIG